MCIWKPYNFWVCEDLLLIDRPNIFLLLFSVSWTEFFFQLQVFSTFSLSIFLLLDWPNIFRLQIFPSRLLPFLRKNAILRWTNWHSFIYKYKTWWSSKSLGSLNPHFLLKWLLDHQRLGAHQILFDNQRPYFLMKIIFIQINIARIANAVQVTNWL